MSRGDPGGSIIGRAWRPDRSGRRAGVIMVVYPMFELNAATLAAVNSPIGAGAGQGGPRA